MNKKILILLSQNETEKWKEYFGGYLKKNTDTLWRYQPNSHYQP